jgi:hypothetical protein
VTNTSVAIFCLKCRSSKHGRLVLRVAKVGRRREIE